jgi:hypothetical protein
MVETRRHGFLIEYFDDKRTVADFRDMKKFRKASVLKASL